MALCSFRIGSIQLTHSDDGFNCFQLGLISSQMYCHQSGNLHEFYLSNSRFKILKTPQDIVIWEGMSYNVLICGSSVNDY